MDFIDAKQQKVFTIPEGTWTLRRLGMTARWRVAGRAAQIIGSPLEWVPPTIQVGAIMQATIDLATVQAPANWDWETCADDAALTALYDQYTAWDESFRAPVAPPAGVMGSAAGSESPVSVPPSVPSAAQ